MVDEILTGKRIIGSLIVFGIVIVLLIFIKQYLIKKVAYRARHNHKNTFQGLLFNLLQYLVIILGVFAILKTNGVNVTGMMASLGIVATIVGLSLQDTFKDLFAGINIYGNNFYKVGDYVRYNNELCEVKFFNARCSKFSSIYTGSTFTVANSCITNIEKIKSNTSYLFYFDFDVDSSKVNEALNNAANKINELDTCKDARNLGVVDINSNGVLYLMLLTVAPKDQLPVKAVLADTAYNEFKRLGIAPAFANDRDIVMSDKKKFYIEANSTAPSKEVQKPKKRARAKAKKV